MGASLQSTEGVVEEIMRIHRSLPARPRVEEVEAARTLIKNVEREVQARLEAISKERKGIGVHGELFSTLQDMQKNLVAYRSREERREADRLMDLERFHSRFDEYLQRASKCIPGAKICEPASHSNGSISGGAVVKNSAVTGSKAAGIDQSTTTPSIVSAGFRAQNQRDVGRSTELVTRDDSYVNRTKAPFLAGGIGGHVAMQSRSVISDSAAKSTPNVGEFRSLELSHFHTRMHGSSSYSCSWLV